MPKVSHATFVDVGLVGPKVSPPVGGVADGCQVDIPESQLFRLTWGMTREDSLSAAMKLLSFKQQGSPDR